VLTSFYFSIEVFDHDMKLALALSADEAMKSKELDIGGSSSRCSGATVVFL